MNCKQVEELISMYIESDVSEEIHRDISLHLEQCAACRKLKEQVEELLYVFPDLEEEVPFFLKNRLYYIPESQEVEILPESRFYYLKWIAAAVGTFVLFLNLFYFTNIYPPANRLLHNVVSEIETFAVETGAFIERVKESKTFSIFSFFKNDSDDRDPEIERKEREAREEPAHSKTDQKESLKENQKKNWKNRKNQKNQKIQKIREKNLKRGEKGQTLKSNAKDGGKNG